MLGLPRQIRPQRPQLALAGPAIRTAIARTFAATRYGSMPPER